MSTNSSKKLMGTGVLAAIAASLCCITPVLAFVAGAGGAASAFSWMEPVRPYLIGITFLVLGFAWWQKLKPVKKVDAECDCEDEISPSFWQSRKFLGIVSVFAAVMLAFPYYSHVFYPEIKSETWVVESGNVQELELEISGMTCTGCEPHVKRTVSKLPGYIDATVIYQEGTATVIFDNTLTNSGEVIEALKKEGYEAKKYF